MIDMISNGKTPGANMEAVATFDTAPCMLFIYLTYLAVGGRKKKIAWESSLLLENVAASFWEWIRWQRWKLSLALP